MICKTGGLKNMLKYMKEVVPQTVRDWHDYFVQEIAAGRKTQSAARTEFSHFLTEGVKVFMRDGMAQEKTVYPRLVRKVSSTKSFERYADTGDPVGIGKVNDHGEYPKLRFSSDTTTIFSEKRGGILEIDRELYMDDQSGTMRGMFSTLGRTFEKDIDKFYANLFNTGDATAGYDGSNIFASTHPDITGGAALSANSNNPAVGTLSHANLDSVLNTLAGWRDFDGEPLSTGVRIVLCAPNQLTEAIQLIHSSATMAETTGTNAFSSGVVNAFRNLGEVIPWSRLTASDWYLITDVMGLIHQEREAPDLEHQPSNTGTAFTNDVEAWKIRGRWNGSVINWRFGLKAN
jgi:phage major head subunit gpT-like protein